jgi:16S rRNA (guanine966-N2)-methyltransferase
VQGRVRLIAGKWRSRKLDVPRTEGLRPTPDRVRETLFNWLTPYLQGANCLDLFAGTGALGFEALSRGAASVVMVEHNRDVLTCLREQSSKLDANDLEIICSDALSWIANNKRTFDIIFVDPPYRANMLDTCVDKLISCGSVNDAALIYVESDSEIQIKNKQVEMIKSANAGKVVFQLLACKRIE